MGRCLASIADIVDEIVVVDTGSDDRSVDIAREHGARLLHHRWSGDFSEARNVALDAARGTWILYIDADEFLAPTTRDHVVASLSDPDRHVAYRIRLRSRPQFSPYLEYRLWRNRPDIRFKGVIHESVVHSIHAVADGEGLGIGVADLLLEHDGYEGDQTHKHARNLPLLLTQVRNDPDRPYLWDHIGRIHQDLGDRAKARESWQHGIDVIRRNGVREPADCLVFFDTMFANFCDGIADTDLVTEACGFFPDNALVLWGAVLDSVVREAHLETIELVTRFLSIPPEVTAFFAVAMNERVAAEWAPNLRGMAYFKVGNWDAAAADFDSAFRANPEEGEYRVKRDLAKARARAAR